MNTSQTQPDIITRARRLDDLTQTTSKVYKMAEVLLAAGDLKIEDVLDTVRFHAESREMVIRVFADTFTAEEMDAAIAWQSSPMGQAIQAKQLEIELRTRDAFDAVLRSCLRD